MEATAEGGFDLLKELLVESLEAAWALSFSDAQEQGNCLSSCTLGVSEAFADGGHGHVDELEEASPGLLKRYLATDDPFAATVLETGLAEVVDAAADGGAARWGVETDTGDHAGGENGDGLHAMLRLFCQP